MELFKNKQNQKEHITNLGENKVWYGRNKKPVHMF